MRLKNFGLMVLAVSLCLSSGSMTYCDETAELERKQALEDAEVQKIQKRLPSRERYEKIEALRESYEKIEKAKQRKSANIDKIGKLIGKLKADVAKRLDEEVGKLDEELGNWVAGLGNRLIISEITPETKNGVVSSFNVETTETGNWLLKTVYPKDRIHRKLSLLSGGIVTGEGSIFTEAGDISLLNTNSILRFGGKVTLKGVIFEGEKDDPLAFVLLDNGLVYITGKGKVTLNNGKSVVLPIE